MLGSIYCTITNYKQSKDCYSKRVTLAEREKQTLQDILTDFQFYLITWSN